MILLKQLAETYREVLPETFLILAEFSPTSYAYIALTQTLWRKTSYLQLG